MVVRLDKLLLLLLVLLLLLLTCAVVVVVITPVDCGGSGTHSRIHTGIIHNDQTEGGGERED